MLDIDECEEGVQADKSDAACDIETSLCSNLVGTFQCNCYQGYLNKAPPGKLTASCFSKLLMVCLLHVLGPIECCADIDECATGDNECVEKCVNGLARPQNYTCGCEDDKYLDGRFRCCKFRGFVQSKVIPV